MTAYTRRGEEREKEREEGRRGFGLIVRPAGIIEIIAVDESIFGLRFAVHFRAGGTQRHEKQQRPICRKGAKEARRERERRELRYGLLYRINQFN